LPVPSHIVERRQFGRRRSRLHALIATRGRPPVPCVICDVSDGGAFVEVANPQWLPSRFLIRLVMNGSESECEITRRTAAGVGVSLAKPLAIDVPSPARRTSAPWYEAARLTT
jgi:hypothetical protein